jgi:hypothetical protein
VYGRDAALIAGALAMLAFLTSWLAVPLMMRASERSHTR